MKMIDKFGAYLHNAFEENGIKWFLIGTESIQHNVKTFMLNTEQFRAHVLSTTKDTFKSSAGQYIEHMRHTIDYKFNQGAIKPI